MPDAVAGRVWKPAFPTRRHVLQLSTMASFRLLLSNLRFRSQTSNPRLFRLRQCFEETLENMLWPRNRLIRQHFQSLLLDVIGLEAPEPDILKTHLLLLQSKVQTRNRKPGKTPRRGNGKVRKDRSPLSD